MNLLHHRLAQRAVAALVAVTLATSGLAGCAAPATTPDAPAWIEGIVVDRTRLAQRGETGYVQVIRDGRSIDASTGMPLRRGDRVVTGPRAEAVIRYASGTELLMRPRSGGEIGSFLRMFGEVFARIRGSFEVETTFVRAAAEGTAFLVRSPAGGETMVIVFDGHVNVDSTRGAWPRVRLAAGQMIVGERRVTEPMTASEAELDATRDWVERLERMVPDSAPAGSSGGSAAAAAAIAVLIGAILVSRSRDREPQRTPDREPDRTPALGAPTGLDPGEAQRGRERVDCSRAVTLRWNSVAGARDYVVRFETLVRTTWQSVAVPATGGTRIVLQRSQLGTANRWSVQAREGNRIGPAAPAVYFDCDFYVVR